MKRNEQQAIEELARLLDGDLRPDDVAGPVRELASLATAVRDEIEVPLPTPAFKAALRTELLDRVAVEEVTLLDRARAAISERTARWKRSAKLVVASATASGMLGTAGVAVAAQQALPGEALYPIKQVTETVRMGFASGAIETGRLHLTFASERLEELTIGIDDYSPDTVIDLLGEMDQSTLAGIEDLLRAYQETDNDLILVVLERFADQQRRGLSAIFDQLPNEAGPFVDRSFEILRRIDITVAAIQDGCANCASDAAGDGALAGYKVNAPGDGPAVDETCDCVSLLPSLLAREGASTASDLRDSLSGDDPDGGTDGTDNDSWDDDLTATVPDLPAPLDGMGRSLETAIGGLSSTTSSLEDTTRTTTDAVEDTTTTVTDTVEDTTGSTTDAVEDTVDDTTEDTTGTLDDLLDDTEDTTLP